MHNWVFLCPAAELGWRGQDDACYYYTIARNIVAGDGVAFDGMNRTNGFHPLWLGVVTGTFALFPSDETAALRLVYALQWVLYVACGAAVGVLALRVVRLRWAVMAVSFFVLLPTIARSMLSGMETALAVACMLAALLWFGRLWSKGTTPDRGSLVLLAALLTAAALARLECALLAVLVTGAVLLRGPFGARRRWAAWVAIGSAAPVIAYLGFSLWYFGAAMPVSGTIKRAEARSMAASLISARNYERYLSEAIDLRTPTDGAADVLQAQLALAPSRPIQVSISYGLLLLPLAVPALRRRLDAPLTVLTAFAVSQVVLGKVFFFGRALPGYYLIAAQAFYPIALVLLLETLVRSIKTARLAAGVQGAVLAGSVVLILACSRHQWHVRHGILTRKEGYYDSTHAAARWLRENSKPEDIVGAWNAGVIGFYANRRVINLDGYVNSVAFAQTLTAPGADIADVVDRLTLTLVVDRISRALTPLDRHPSLAANWRLVVRVDGPRPQGLNGGFCVYRQADSETSEASPIGQAVAVREPD